MIKDKEKIIRKIKNIRKMITELDNSYYTENGLAFKSGMIHIFNIFVNELLGKEGGKFEL